MLTGATLSIIFYSILAFSGVILLLVFVLMYAQAKLVNSGDVQIIVNGDTANPMKVAAGSTLLSTLSERKLFLPSACGGGGTCAMCKCQILEGGGDVLPTEKGHLNRREQAEHWRLACQVKVKNDMKIQIPEEIFGIKKWECEVVSNYNVATFIKEFTVKLPEGENLHFEAGGISRSMYLLVPLISKTSISLHRPMILQDRISLRKIGTNSNFGISKWSIPSPYSVPIPWPTTLPKETSSS